MVETDRIKKAYANIPLFSMFNRGVKSESSNTPIKPNQILGIIPFLVLLFGVNLIILIVWTMFTHFCDINDIEFHKVYYLVEGLIISIPSIMIISYIKWGLLTCENDFPMFAGMRSLSIIAVYPFLTSVIKYFGITSFSYMYIHISPYEVFDFIVMAWLVVESVYTAKRWREHRANKAQEGNHRTSL